MINEIPKKFLKDKILTKEWVKSKLEDFKKLNPHFISYDDYTQDEHIKYIWEYMCFIFYKIYKGSQAKSST